VRHLKGKRGEFKRHASLNWEPVYSWSVYTKNKCDGFCVITLAAAFCTLCKRAMVLDGEPYKTELA